MTIMVASKRPIDRAKFCGCVPERRVMRESLVERAFSNGAHRLASSRARRPSRGRTERGSKRRGALYLEIPQILRFSRLIIFMDAHASESQGDGASRTSFGLHADNGLSEGEMEIHFGEVALRVHRQSSTGNPGTWENSLALLVTKVALSDSA
jgi:hypothetical protein